MLVWLTRRKSRLDNRALNTAEVQSLKKRSDLKYVIVGDVFAEEVEVDGEAALGAEEELPKGCSSLEGEAGGEGLLVKGCEYVG